MPVPRPRHQRVYRAPGAADPVPDLSFLADVHGVPRGMGAARGGALRARGARTRADLHSRRDPPDVLADRRLRPGPARGRRHLGLIADMEGKVFLPGPVTLRGSCRTRPMIARSSLRLV